MKKYNAIILAAGYGSRLAPITDNIPKPLEPVGDRTLLENILINLSTAGIANFAINTHHLGFMIEDFCEKTSFSKNITIYNEKEILGTGGPLVNAKKLLFDCDAFVLHNGDILTDINIAELLDFHTKSKCLCTMALIDGPENKISITKNKHISDILGILGRETDELMLTYSGVSVYSPEIFNYLPKNVENASIITAILNALKKNPECVAAFCPDKKETYWNDLGTVTQFLQAKKDIDNKKINLPHLDDITQPPLSELKNPGASERVFFRLQTSEDDINANKIIMCSGNDTIDFERFINIGTFLNENKLGTPEFYDYSLNNHTVIMEDLGNNSLYKLMQENISDEEKIILYKKIINWLVDFQSKTYDKICEERKDEPNDDCLALRDFDFDYLRWETEYFQENFLENYCGIRNNKLNCEFRTLAEECLKQPQVLIHRDFQSQNVLLKNNVVRIVDFQGARRGNIAYDLVSLLNDSYLPLSLKVKHNLLKYYYLTYSKSLLFDKFPFSEAEFAKFAISASLQRIMQALGAFTYLGLKKGKKEYLSYIPQGLKNLKNVLSEMKQNKNVFQMNNLEKQINLYEI